VIEVTFNGLTQLLGDMKALPTTLEKKVILNMSQIAQNSAERGAGAHGSLRNTIENRQITGGRVVGHDASAGLKPVFVNFGTRRHWIGPRDKKALRWAGPAGFIFSKGHWHPGYVGDAYMDRAQTDAVAQFQTILDTALKEAL